MGKKPKYFILDVDGVLTDGKFIYSNQGKKYKVFGPHDHDGLKMIKDLISIEFITADKNGYAIIKRRVVNDMKFKLSLVSEKIRINYLEKKFGLKNIIYMGDGIFDAEILKNSLYGIAPNNARIEAKNSANFVTKSKGGNGAVMDACIHINKKFLILLKTILLKTKLN